MAKPTATHMKHRLKNYRLTALLSLPLLLLSHEAFAEELSALSGATNWVTKTLISIALTVLGLQIIYSLWQVNQGQKEWREVAKPIIITALIVAVPAIISALRTAMGSF
ncbi:hypothetical protein [Legionella tunisiensis]|uniref:hypothetical protein n=1 Tax=Legionella tunisiensis TaxID=1034944 RepID=UPI000314F915|nr:hypothetical protein [Legionella tunisiensis]